MSDSRTTAGSRTREPAGDIFSAQINENDTSCLRAKTWPKVVAFAFTLYGCAEQNTDSVTLTRAIFTMTLRGPTN